MRQTSTATFKVPDMSCGHCSATIRQTLEKRLPGAHVEIDLATSQVKVTGDDSAAAAAIREAGYTPEQIK